MPAVGMPTSTAEVAPAARGAVSTTERAVLIGRVRALACRTAECYLDQKQTREQRS